MPPREEGKEGNLNESAIGFKRWIDLKNIQNKSISGSYESENERFEFEKYSLNNVSIK